MTAVRQRPRQNGMSAVLYIVIPAYNEAENIRRVAEEWYAVVEAHAADGRSRLLVVDDGSTDETPAILAELRADRPLLEVLSQTNGGHGAAVLAGYRRAIADGADMVFQTDADGQTDPAQFEAFWEIFADSEKARRPCAAVFGNRAARQDGWERKFVESALTRALRAMFGVRIPDANAPFRLMRADLVKKYLPLLPGDSEIPNVMLTLLFVYYGERVTFLPISFRPRQGGESSLGRKKILRMGVRALRSLRELRTGMPPR